MTADRYGVRTPPDINRVITVILFTTAKTLSPSSSSAMSFLFEGFEILYIFVLILVDLWQCPSCINTCVGERLCVAWGAGHRVLSRMSYCPQRSSSLLLFPNLLLVPRCCYFLCSICQVILWRTQSDRQNLGNAGLDGDLKKAMKDGKPVIIEVRLHSLMTLVFICKQSKQVHNERLYFLMDSTIVSVGSQSKRSRRHSILT